MAEIGLAYHMGREFNEGDGYTAPPNSPVTPKPSPVKKVRSGESARAHSSIVGNQSSGIQGQAQAPASVANGGTIAQPAAAPARPHTPRTSTTNSEHYSVRTVFIDDTFPKRVFDEQKINNQLGNDIISFDGANDKYESTQDSVGRSYSKGLGHTGMSSKASSDFLFAGDSASTPSFHQGRGEVASSGVPAQTNNNNANRSTPRDLDGWYSSEGHFEMCRFTSDDSRIGPLPKNFIIPKVPKVAEKVVESEPEEVVLARKRSHARKEPRAFIPGERKSARFAVKEPSPPPAKRACTHRAKKAASSVVLAKTPVASETNLQALVIHYYDELCETTKYDTALPFLTDEMIAYRMAIDSAKHGESLSGSQEKLIRDAINKIQNTKESGHANESTSQDADEESDFDPSSSNNN